MTPKDVAGDEVRLGRLGNVGRALGQDRVAVVGAAVAGEEADEALGDVSIVRSGLRFSYGERSHFEGLLC